VAVASKRTCVNNADLLRILDDSDDCISSNDSGSEDLDGGRVHGQLSNRKSQPGPQTFSWQHVDVIIFQ
jgi:hypothetical protein